MNDKNFISENGEKSETHSKADINQSDATDSNLTPKSKGISKKTSDILWYIVIGFLVIAIILVLLFKFVFFMRVEVFQSSMEPTYHQGDKLWVNKVAKFKSGDVIVFKYGNDYLIKRLIAVGGDTIKIERGVLSVKPKGSEDFVKWEEDYINKPWNENNNYHETVIEEGKCFVMGDNRNDSKDSRSFGSINISDIIGKVI